MEGRHHPMSALSLQLTSVGKTFNRRTIFRDISAGVDGPGSMAITGRNGSGKSTLAKIIAGVLSPSAGSVALTVGGRAIDRSELSSHLGFVAPYLQLYDEFTAAENIAMLTAMRTGASPEAPSVDALLDRVGLLARRNDRVGTFSSGMKQRVKYCVALIHQPALLILDEPTSNLDTDGSAFVRSVVEECAQSAIVIVATNEKEEAEWCISTVTLGIRA